MDFVIPKFETLQSVIIAGEKFPFYTGRIGKITKRYYIDNGIFRYKVRFDLVNRPLWEPKTASRKSMYDGHPSNIQYKVFEECEIIPNNDIAKALYCD